MMLAIVASMAPVLATPPDHDTISSPSELELGVIKDARRRQRRRRLVMVLLAFAAIGGYLGIRQNSASAPRSESLLSRPMHLPSLGPRGQCPVSSGYTVKNSDFGGTALGSGPVRVLVASTGSILHGRPELGTTEARGWYALKTLWFAMPGYDGPFIVRGGRLGKRGPIEVQPSGTGLLPGSGPLIVPAGATINTYYTNWRPGHVRDPVTGRLVPTLTGYGYRTVPGSTWVRSPGCYAWQIDGRGFSEVIVIDALAPGK
jgi:hypothetical protein